MNLLLKRKKSSKGATIGELFLNGIHECYIVEDVVRKDGEKKIHGETAIPAGKYQVVNTYSPRFEKYLPLLLNVPNYAGIRIHTGNKSADTEGCLLPGRTLGKDGVTVEGSRIAFDALFRKLKAVEKKEQIVITIANE